MNRLSVRLAVACGLLLLASSASAHTGHGTHGLMEGLAHPLGLDHLLAMVAVGVWSSIALRGSAQWLGPMTFLAALVCGAALGVSGVASSWVEPGVALSVVLFGAMLVLARQLPAAAGLLLTGMAASLHGLAHVAEIPVGATVLAYGLGFVMSTAALHLGGMAAGRWVQSAQLRTQLWTWRAAAALLSGAGLWMFARL